MQFDFVSSAQPTKDIQVKNNDKERDAYVQVEAYLIENPAKPNEKQTEIKDPQKLGLLVTPKKFKLSAGEAQYVRVNKLNPFDDKEHIYRIIIKPVAGDLTSIGDPKSMAAQVQVLIGYGLLAIVRPKKMDPKLTLKQTGNVIEAHNSGNTSILLNRGTLCSTKKDDPKKSECIDLPVKRLYPNDTWTHALTGSGTVTFNKNYADINIKISPEVVEQKSLAKGPAKPDKQQKKGQ